MTVRLTLLDLGIAIYAVGLAVEHCSMMIDAERSDTIPGTPNTQEIDAWRLEKKRCRSLLKRLKQIHQKEMKCAAKHS